ncbi:MAG TPA: DUF1992 domain-containing protein [Nocardioidaceae bacterium]|nr:DUF1992 domain-containing protein [Nocardioidaceae bacterium]
MTDGRRSDRAYRDREVERQIEEERRMRRARITAATGQAPAPDPDPDTKSDAESAEDEEDNAASLRMEQQTLWVDLQVRKAMERGEFDNLPGAGKPIKGLGSTHDPDWWVKSLIEREQITGVLPPALALRKEHAELDALLDREATEEGVRRVVQDFNRRVVDARRQLLGGPPVITPTRDEDAEVVAWRARRTERRERQRRLVEETSAASAVRPRRSRWWHRTR